MLRFVRKEVPVAGEAAALEEQQRKRGERKDSQGHVITSRKASWIPRGEVGNFSSDLLRALCMPLCHWSATLLGHVCCVPRLRARAVSYLSLSSGGTAESQ